MLVSYSIFCVNRTVDKYSNKLLAFSQPHKMSAWRSSKVTLGQKHDLMVTLMTSIKAEYQVETSLDLSITPVLSPGCHSNTHYGDWA